VTFLLQCLPVHIAAGALQPVAPDERVELLDILRGFALFGVLVANICWWTQDFALPTTVREALPTAGLDELVLAFVLVFIDWKFYTLFSFLFGLGFSVQLMRAEARGSDALPVYRRRLLVLLIIGLVHHFLIWAGDILHPYALLGFVLIFFRRASGRTLLIAGLLLAVIVPGAYLAVRGALTPAADFEAARKTEEALHTMNYAAFRGGSYVGVVRAYATNYFSIATLLFFAEFLTSIFGKFLLGFYAGRTRLLHEPLNHIDLFRRLLVWGLPIGILANTLWLMREKLMGFGYFAPSSPLVLVSHTLVYLGLLAMTAAYVAAIVLLYQRPRWARHLSHLAPVGRMALTNYLTHSVLYVVLFYGVGFGLLGRVGAAAVVAMAVLIYAAQMAFSAWWLQRYRFGPAEWLWRSLTYGQAQPMRAREIGLSETTAPRIRKI
jgi:uncharacterized protein